MRTRYDNTGLLKVGSGPGYQLTGITYILTGTTTYSTPLGTRAIIARLIAAGGSGGSVSTAASMAAAGGGAGGQYAEKLIANPAASYAVSVAASTAASATGANAGATGADTVFGASLAVAKGGLGGAADTGTTVAHVGGLGGDSAPTASAVGDLIVLGQPGGTGLVLGPTGQCISGFGGQSARGFGGGALGRKNSTGAGVDGFLYGSGGSGGALITSGASQAGGKGATGLLIVEAYA